MRGVAVFLKGSSTFVEEEQRNCVGGTRKVDIRLPGKGNSNSRGARPVYSFR